MTICLSTRHNFIFFPNASQYNVLLILYSISFVYFAFKLNYNPITVAKTSSFWRPNCIVPKQSIKNDYVYDAGKKMRNNVAHEKFFNGYIPTRIYNCGVILRRRRYHVIILCIHHILLLPTAL